MLKNILYAILIYFPVFGYSQTIGALDNSFGANGLVVTIMPYNSHINDIQLQADGKIVVMGETTSPLSIGVDNMFLGLRYNSNGLLDSTFGTNGIVITNFDTLSDIANAFNIQPNGKILVGGFSTSILSGNYDFALARYNIDGSLDNSFDGDGKLTVDWGFQEIIQDISLQPDGKIVAVGSVDKGNGDVSFAISRYNSDGSLDASFDGDGKLSSKIEGKNGGALGVKLQLDGKIVVVGRILDSITNTSDFAVARYNLDGSLDNNFSGDGQVSIDFNFGNDIATCVFVDSLTGNIFVGGSAYNSSMTDLDFAIVCLDANGELNLSFNTSGKQMIWFGNGDETAQDIVSDCSGNIVLVGRCNSNNKSGLGITNLSSTGITLMKNVTELSSGSGASSTILQADGKLLVAGETATMASSHGNPVIAKYFLCSPLAVEANTSMYNFKIYPNPISANSCNIEYFLEENCRVNTEIYDFTGKIVYFNILEGKIGHNTEIVFWDKLPKGCYLMKIRIGFNVLCKKIINA